MGAVEGSAGHGKPSSCSGRQPTPDRRSDRTRGAPGRMLKAVRRRCNGFARCPQGRACSGPCPSARSGPPHWALRREDAGQISRETGRRADQAEQRRRRLSSSRPACWQRDPYRKRWRRLEGAAKFREETSGSAETTLPSVQCASSEGHCKRFVRCNNCIALHQGLRVASGEPWPDPPPTCVKERCSLAQFISPECP